MNISNDSGSVRFLYRATQVIWYVLYLIEILLGFRFFLRFLAANPAAEFTSFIYNTSYPLVAPFLNVFPVGSSEGMKFEWPTLLAMFVYWMIAYALIRLILMGQPVSGYEAKAKLDEQDKQ